MVWATVSRDALVHNTGVMRKFAGRRKLYAVVKANGYGHGMAEVAKAIADKVDGFCVFVVPDGVRLREIGITGPIVVLGGLQDEEGASATSCHKLSPAVGSEESLKLACRTKNGFPRAFIKVQTGMHRLGLQVGAVEGAAGQLRQSGCGELALMHHYSDADIEGGTKSQDKVMARLVEKLRLPYTASNSAATIMVQETAEDFVRCGISIYGYTPFPHGLRPASELGLKPAMALEGKVIAMQKVKRGDSVGYGSRWHAKNDTIVAVIGCGYSHGYPRHAPDGTPVWVNGKARPIVGRVSMEMMTVECPDGDVKVGDSAELWGEHIALDDVANRSGTIGYELVASLPPTVQKRHV